MNKTQLRATCTHALAEMQVIQLMLAISFQSSLPSSRQKVTNTPLQKANASTPLLSGMKSTMMNQETHSALP